jgi:hypothetical protein
MPKRMSASYYPISITLLPPPTTLISIFLLPISPFLLFFLPSSLSSPEGMSRSFHPSHSLLSLVSFLLSKSSYSLDLLTSLTFLGTLLKFPRRPHSFPNHPRIKFILCIAIDPRTRKYTTRIPSPIADSAAATVSTYRANTCPILSSK